MMGQRGERETLSYKPFLFLQSIQKLWQHPQSEKLNRLNSEAKFKNIEFLNSQDYCPDLLGLLLLFCDQVHKKI